VTATQDNEVLWEPSAEFIAGSEMARYLSWLGETRDLKFESYADLWQWSVAEIEEFWASIWDYFQIIAHAPYSEVLPSRAMPGARWFPGAQLNYTEHALRRRDDHPAVIAGGEDRPLTTLTYAELANEVAACAAGLRRLGVGRGDRVGGFLPNVPEALVAFLAAASLGAVWSCCSPEFGVPSVVERLQQIEPKVLLAVPGYRYNGRWFDRREAVAEIVAQLRSLEAVVWVVAADAGSAVPSAPVQTTWSELLGPNMGVSLEFESVPFDHPLWILYSSGTTGLPKPIVHGHGGILLEHLRCLSLQTNVGPDDRFFWFSSTGWMMWNKLISGLLLGATIVLYDGSPSYPDLNVLWRFAEQTEMTYFGTSAPFLLACRKAGLEPGRDFDLTRLEGMGSTGAPLPPEGFRWVYDAVSSKLLLGSTSGGTDVCTSFVGASPLLPVRAGEIQCRYLGIKAEAFDPQGHSIIDEVGELVITEPLPSMPIYLWNDPEFERYRESYFSVYPGVWRHGDWIRITPSGSCVIYGRSDSTLNRGGVRMGTSEFYRVVEDIPEVADSLVVDTSRLGAEGRLLLFVVLREGVELDEGLRGRIRRALALQLSPRHVPDEIYAVEQIPRTLNGKKIEVPVKRILAGVPAEKAASEDAMSNPDSLRFFVDLAETMQGG
jgi:acetoacetyl-CoA synthetase